MFEASVITVSDKGYAGLREDRGGPLAAQILEEAGYRVAHRVMVPDEQSAIEDALIRAADEWKCALIVTTGGTGFSPRDVTPEATAAVCQRMAPGIAEYMRAQSLLVTNRAILSRAAAGIRGLSLIVNLPGSPKAVRENLSCILPPLEHGLQILRGEAGECAQPEKPLR